jgi:hypothetical protein
MVLRLNLGIYGNTNRGKKGLRSRTTEKGYVGLANGEGSVGQRRTFFRRVLGTMIERPAEVFC